jgi:S1/P1 Nuclease
VYKELSSTATLIQTTTTEAPQRTYVLDRIGCAQEDHQLLRQGRERPHLPGRKGRRRPARNWTYGSKRSQVDEAYYRNEIKVVDERLAQAGARLATLLNQALLSAPSKK